MIKDNQKHFNRLRLIVDAAVTVGSYLLAWWLKFESPFFEGHDALSFNSYVRALYFIVPAYVILYYYFGVYTPKRGVKNSGEFFEIVKANIAGVIAVIFILYMMKITDFSRMMIGIFMVLNITISGILHSLLRKMLAALRRAGYNVKYVLLVGYSRAAEEYIKRIVANPQWGYQVRGILDDDVPAGTMFKGVKVIGRIDNLKVILPNSTLDEIAITISLKDYERLEEIVDLCEKSGVHTKFIPDYASIIPTIPYTEDINGLAAINIRYVPLSNTINRIVKRLCDIFISLVAIVVTSPLMLTIALLIKKTDNGPIIFKQERVGLHGKKFYMYKFRSMRVQTVEEEKSGWTTKDDPRVTKVGKFIRKTSIDELPQLFNILKGEMSVVGPRPERPQYVDKFKEEIPRYMIKHQVRPGLTGWAQVNGFRGDTSIYKRIEYDLYYIENWSFFMDVKIIFLTFFVGFINKNAY